MNMAAPAGAGLGTPDKPQETTMPGMKMPKPAAAGKKADMQGMPPGEKEMSPDMAMGADIGDVPFDSALINGRGALVTMPHRWRRSTSSRARSCGCD